MLLIVQYDIDRDLSLRIVKFCNAMFQQCSLQLIIIFLSQMQRPLQWKHLWHRGVSLHFQKIAEALSRLISTDIFVHLDPRQGEGSVIEEASIEFTSSNGS